MKLRVDLKLQHRISRSHSSSRYLENANSQNVFMWQYLYGIAEEVVQRCSEKFPKIYRKTSVLKSLLVKLQARDLHRYKTETPAQTFSSEFARLSRTPILYGLKTLYSRLQIYWYFTGLTVSQYLRYWVFPQRSIFQLILPWWASIQPTDVDNATMITKVDRDIQTASRGNFESYFD